MKIFRCECCEQVVETMPVRLKEYQTDFDKVLNFKDSKVCIICYIEFKRWLSFLR